MSQKNHNYTCETVLYYIFFLIFVVICLQETQIWKHRVIGIEKNHAKLQMIYIHTITKLGIHVEKKL